MARATRKLWSGRWVVTAFVVAAVALSALVIATAAARNRARSSVCVKTVGSICLAARMYAAENQERFPETFAQMSNELGSLKVLICPADKSRPMAASWAVLQATNSSYRILAPGIPSTNASQPYLKCLYHNHTGLVNSTVVPGPQRRSKKAKAT